MIKDVTNSVPTAQTEELNLQKPESMADVTAYKEQLKLLPEVQNLTSAIDINDGNSVLNFGQSAATGIANVSSELLERTKRVNAEEATAMLNQLTKVMNKLDIADFEPNKDKNALQKLFTKMSAKIDKMLTKYENMGKEVDEIAKLLAKYLVDIQSMNNGLDQLFHANVESYQNLEKYIVACDIAQTEIAQYETQLMASPVSEQEKQMTQQRINTVKELISQRQYDLLTAENVAMQTVPMIQMMQMSNFNLMRKINSSFIITLPIFKQCLVQAMTLKRQEVMAKSLQDLDDKTNELLMRNAQATANQSVNIAKMASGSSIKAHTLESTYNTIMKGIEDTKAISKEQAEARITNSQTLEGLKHSLKKANITSAQPNTLLT